MLVWRALRTVRSRCRGSRPRLRWCPAGSLGGEAELLVRDRTAGTGSSRYTSWAGRASQSRAVRSAPAVKTDRPSGLKATLLTRPSCRKGRPSGWPVATSQIRAEWSQLAVASRLPSGLNATPRPGRRAAGSLPRGPPVAVVPEPCRVLGSGGRHGLAVGAEDCDPDFAVVRAVCAAADLSQHPRAGRCGRSWRRPRSCRRG